MNVCGGESTKRWREVNRTEGLTAHEGVAQHPPIFSIHSVSRPSLTAGLLSFEYLCPHKGQLLAKQFPRPSFLGRPDGSSMVLCR